MGKVEMHTWYRQYQKLKAQYPDTILLYRLGEFYETFDDDAKLVAELMDTTLTRKEHAVEKSTKEKQYCPMAGIPFHAAENYVARLVSQGYRVAIAEQMSETSSSKSDTRPRSVFASGLEQTSRQRGLVHREVVRVITPGTVLDPSMLPTSKNNYLAAVIAEGDRIGLSYTDLSTGEFAATEFSGERATTRLEGELARLHVSEVLVHEHTSQQVPGLTPVRASLSQDLAPMTKQEREHLLPHERVARRLEQENAARWTQGNVTPAGGLAMGACNGLRYTDAAVGRAITGRVWPRPEAARHASRRSCAALYSRDPAQQCRTDYHLARLYHRLLYVSRPANAAQPGTTGK